MVYTWKDDLIRSNNAIEKQLKEDAKKYWPGVHDYGNLKKSNIDNVFGHCQFWDIQRGFGWIWTDVDLIGSVFVHRSKLRGVNELEKGDFVVMDVKYNQYKKKQQGVNVRDGVTFKNIEHHKRKILYD